MLLALHVICFCRLSLKALLHARRASKKDTGNIADGTRAKEDLRKELDAHTPWSNMTYPSRRRDHISQAKPSNLP